MSSLQETPTYPIWNRIGLRPHFGVALPLSALHSQKSCGIGEFLDLLPLIDWCQEVKMDVIQLLPLNDTGQDPSPYNAISSKALSPLFLSLHALPWLDQSPLETKLKEMQALNSSSKVAFSEVRTEKMLFLSAYYECYQEQLLSLPGYQEFIDQNAWIKPYALFKVLKDKTGQVHYLFWPGEYKDLSPASLKPLYDKYAKELSFYCLLQYLCYLQLTRVKQIANQQGILLKGDIPILISPDSADVWSEPEFFNLELSAGAPPDLYNPQGQYWGFPIFHWDAMKKSGFSWWKAKLAYAGHFYDLYRMDHVLGLFRLWAIPPGLAADKGWFIPSEESLWGLRAEELLQVLIASSPMLPIAEDLGTVPPIVRPTLEKFGLCGTKVLRWERHWEGDGSFIDPASFSPLSMTCLSTHDSPTLEQWWRDFPKEAKVYALQKNWTYSPKITHEQRIDFLIRSHQSQSLFHINLLSEYLALVPELVSSNPYEERINIPGTINASNWTYRFRRSIEEIAQNAFLKKEMQKITWSKRTD